MSKQILWQNPRLWMLQYPKLNWKDVINTNGAKANIFSSAATVNILPLKGCKECPLKSVWDLGSWIYWILNIIFLDFLVKKRFKNAIFDFTRQFDSSLFLRPKCHVIFSEDINQKWSCGCYKQHKSTWLKEYCNFVWCS